MVGAARHADHVAALDLDAEHRADRRMDVEKAAAADHEAHLVLVVPVLLVEAVEQRVEARGRGMDVDDVRGGVAAARLELLDRLAVGVEDLFVGRLFGQAVDGLEPAIPDTVLAEEGGDLRRVGKGLLLVAEGNGSHGKPPR